MAGPITEDAIDNCAQIELRAKCVKHGAVADAGNEEGRLVCLECMSALGGLHGRVHNGLELNHLLVNLDCLEGPRYKHEVYLEGLGTTIRHGS